MYMGIDFGSKRLGVAFSDTSGTMAFPHDVIPMNSATVSVLEELVRARNVTGIVVGDTRTSAGEANEVTAHLASFLETLKSAVTVPVYVVPEFGTSGAARTSPWEGGSRGVIASPRAAAKDTLHDARAAALILQRFLETQKK
jgi:putative Holliday junction resolvase